MFSFFGNETHFTTLFKGTNLHSLQNKMLYTATFETKTFKHNGKQISLRVYQVTCLDCGKKYTGQTGEEF
jgi:hypothetical protein